MNQGQLQAYEEIGIEKYQFVAALSERTCDTCGGLDGKEFYRDEAREGDNYPPMHANCRCTTIMAGTDPKTRIARDPETGKNYKVDGNMTFNEWKESLTDEQCAAMEKHVDKFGESGIMNIGSGKIMSINNIDSPIEQRNTGKGNPNAIIHADRPLSNRQKKLLDNLPEYDSSVIIPKKNVNMRDLSALTAYTGDEFAVFTKKNERLVIRGNQNSVNVNIVRAKELSAQGYKWSGHTHPGIGRNCLQASFGDKEILKCFKQKVAYIYNSQGDYLEFGKE